MNDLNDYEDYVTDYEEVFSTINSLKSDISNDDVKTAVEDIIEILHNKLDADYDTYNQRLETAYDEDKKYQQKEYWNSQF